MKSGAVNKADSPKGHADPASHHVDRPRNQHDTCFFSGTSQVAVRLLWDHRVPVLWARATSCVNQYLKVNLTCPHHVYLSSSEVSLHHKSELHSTWNCSWLHYKQYACSQQGTHCSVRRCALSAAIHCTCFSRQCHFPSMKDHSHNDKSCLYTMCICLLIIIIICLELTIVFTLSDASN